MNATCQFEYAFTITGRGLVLVVEISAGVICVGDLVVVPVGDSVRRERIGWVNPIQERGPPRDVVGLLLQEIGSADVPAIKGALHAGQMLQIEPGPEDERAALLESVRLAQARGRRAKG